MAKICPNCKASMPDQTKFCTECGTLIPEAPKPVAEPMRNTTTVPVTPTMPNPAPIFSGEEFIPPKGSKYDPITTKGFIGIALLMCIPIVGIVLTIIWACGGCKKINKRNLARASLIMMAIGLVLSLILGIAVKALFRSAVEQAETEMGISFEELSEEPDSENADLAALIGGLAALSGENSNATNEDIQELEELQNALEQLEGVTGDDYNGLTEFIEGAQQANQDAEAANDGWPKSLRAYPNGTAKAVASYRTEISDTSPEEMMSWIDDLKKDGFAFKDFYEFGFSESDMLSMNSWWATDGEIYLSVSYYEGVVTIDHTKELPDLSSYFG